MAVLWLWDSSTGSGRLVGNPGRNGSRDGRGTFSALCFLLGTPVAGLSLKSAHEADPHPPRAHASRRLAGGLAGLSAYSPGSRRPYPADARRGCHASRHFHFAPPILSGSSAASAVSA